MNEKNQMKENYAEMVKNGKIVEASLLRAASIGKKDILFFSRFDGSVFGVVSEQGTLREFADKLATALQCPKA